MAEPLPTSVPVLVIGAGVHGLSTAWHVAGRGGQVMVVDKMGVGWETLRAINPKLVYASGTGYGLTGPNRNLPAFDPVVQAILS